MKFNHLFKPFFIVMLVLGLVAGCASTPDNADSVSGQSTAEQAIADAKSSNAQAKKMGAEWRDTGKMIKKAEKALADGDDAKATKIANKSQRQAENAMKQAKSEKARLTDSGAISGAGAASASEDSASSRRGGAAMAGGADSYEVVGGDNLWNISAKDSIYANPYQWPLIYKANREQIKDADLIYAGQVFDIDRSASGADVNAAVDHAKSRGAWSVGSTEASDEAYLAQ